MKNRISKIIGIPIFTLNIILILSVIGSLIVWGLFADKKAQSKFQTCSRYTVGNIIELEKRTFKNPDLVYVFYYNHERIEHTGRPNPRNVNDWLRRNDNYWQKNWVGHRVWVQVYCNDAKLHRVLWNQEVPDTIHNVPDAGWESPPLQ